MMDKFWKWMIEKKYAYIFTDIDMSDGYKLYDNDGDGCHYTKKMIIGYMLDYIYYNNKIKYIECIILSILMDGNCFYTILELIIKKANDEI